MLLRKNIVFLLIAAAVLSSDLCLAEDNRPMPSDLKFPPISFSPPKPERVALKNGMVLFLLKNDELPVLDINAVVRTGAAYEPDDKIGLAGLTATVMRTGGASSMSGDEVDEKLEFIAGGIDLQCNQTHLMASLSILKKDVDLGLRIYSDILMRPAFEQAKIDLAQKALIEGIRRKNDDPGAIAAREFGKLVYSGHPFGREPAIATVSSIKRDDLLDFHQKYFHPNRIIMSVTGDFQREEIIRKIEAAFKGWEPAREKLPAVKPIEKKFPLSVNYIEKDTTQSVVRMGHLGVKISNPDHFALQLMNDILGGSSFQSRLMQDIRTDRGLAYSVWSHFGAGVFDYDVFAVGVETKASTTAEVIRLVLGHIQKMREEPVSEQDLENAKQFLINSFVFKFASSAQVTNRMALFEFYGIPIDYLDKYLENIRKVTREDIQKAAREYLHPDGIIITVVGDQKKFDAPLSAFGEVRSIPLEKFE
ncbi:MAG: insulinase family protein [Nitrospinae bacterium]|nr:insulinase family protein [Nitrospinota bacterium]